MALITTFRATLACLHCKYVGVAEIQSKLGSKGSTYGVGDCPSDDIILDDFYDTSLTVRAPSAQEPVHDLLSWTCTKCGFENFAEIAFFDGCVKSIDAVELDTATLHRVHFLAHSLEYMLETIIGVPLWSERGLLDDWLPRLMGALDAGRRWGLEAAET